MTPRWFVLVPSGLSLLALGGAAVLLVSGGRLRENAARVESWTEVDAVITESRVVSHERRDPDSGQWETWREAQLGFEYVIDGKSYSGTKLDWMGTGGDATKIVATYPVGAKVHAYYDPAKPTDAALTRATTGRLGGVGLQIGGAFLILVAIGLGYVAYRIGLSARRGQ